MRGRLFDRLRLLHRTAGENQTANDPLAAENEMPTSLQLGLRQRRLPADGHKANLGFQGF